MFSGSRLLRRDLRDNVRQHAMRQVFEVTWAWVRVQFFRFWTALAVLGTYGYLWIDRPEYLSWWKRSVDALIESGSAQLPYPWGDRIESTIGNFGIGSK